MIRISERSAKLSAKPSAGPVTTPISQKTPATRSVYHQRPRTSSELPRKVGLGQLDRRVAEHRVDGGRLVLLAVRVADFVFSRTIRRGV